MTGLTEAQLAADAQRTLDQREAAGLPRHIEDPATLDRIASLVVAGRRRAAGNESAARAGNSRGADGERRGGGAVSANSSKCNDDCQPTPRV